MRRLTIATRLSVLSRGAASYRGSCLISPKYCDIPKPYSLASRSVILTFGFLQIGVVLMKRHGGGEKIAVPIDERRNGCSTQHRAPAIIFPLGIEREVNSGVATPGMS